MRRDVGVWISYDIYDMLRKVRKKIVKLTESIFKKFPDSNMYIVHYKDHDNYSTPHVDDVFVLPLRWVYGHVLLQKILYKYTGFLQQINARNNNGYARGLYIS